MKYIYIVLILLLTFVILDTIVHNINYQKLEKNFPKNIEPSDDFKMEILKNSDPYDTHTPLTVTRTYIDKEKAKKFSKASEVTHENNPYLKEFFYDDNDVDKFIKEHYTERVYNAYQKINPQYGPARADFFRYLVIYYYGGMYLDVKSFVRKNIRKLFNQNKLVISKGRTMNYNPNTFGIIPTIKNNYDWGLFSGVNCGEYNNWHFIAPPRHPVLGHVIKQIVYNIENGHNKYNYGEYSVLALTGPIMFSRVISRYGNENNLMIMEPNYNKSVKYSIFKDHKKDNKNHYSKLENKNVLLR